MPRACWPALRLNAYTFGESRAAGWLVEASQGVLTAHVYLSVQRVCVGLHFLAFVGSSAAVIGYLPSSCADASQYYETDL